MFFTLVVLDRSMIAEFTEGFSMMTSLVVTLVKINVNGSCTKHTDVNYSSTCFHQVM